MKPKNISAGLRAVFVLLLAFSASALLYAILRRQSIRVDFNKNHPDALSEETKKVLIQFGSNPIDVLAFYPSDHPDRTFLEDLLKDCVSLDPNLKYQMIDPDRSPLIARKYNIDAYGITVIRSRGREVRLESVSEQDLTSAFSKILSDEVKIIYFVEGHHEPSLKDQGENGYSGFAARLKNTHHEVREIDLTKPVVKDADLLILAGPHVDLSDAELNRLLDYFNSGVRVVLAIDPVLPGEGNQLQSFLLKLGIDLGNDVIVDRLSKQVGADYLVPMIAEYGHHPMVNQMKTAAFFPLVRSVRKAEKIPPDITVTELAFTGVESWAETDLKALEAGKADYDDGVDLPGPISLAAIAEGNEGKKKMVVIGDSDLVGNMHLHVAGNKLFMMNLIEWLLGERVSFKQPPNKSIRNLFILNQKEEAEILTACVIVIPATYLAIGLVLFFWRRRYV